MKQTQKKNVLQIDNFFMVLTHKTINPSYLRQIFAEALLFRFQARKAGLRL